MQLGFDLGTTNVKALVVDDSGRVRGSGSAPVDRFTTPDGGVEQDIEQIWTAALAAGQQAVSNGGEPIRAIGVSSQGGALQVLDSGDRPLGRVISWLDRRGAPYDRELVEQLGSDWLAEHVGHGDARMTLGQVLRLQHQSPGLLRAPNRLAFVGDVIVGRLCGRRAHDPTSLAIALLYNPWIGRADPELLARLDLRADQLPDLVEVDAPAGGLLPEIASRLGLVAGIPVSAAVHDQYAAALGAGAVVPGDINFGAGTAWVLLANTAMLGRPVLPRAFVAPHPVPGVWGQMLSLINGGSALDWAWRLLGHASGAMQDLDEHLRQVAPGCDGLRCRPLLVPGAEPDARFAGGGRFDGVRLAHGPGHVLRAVVEGLVFELARHVRLLAEAGLGADRLMMAGSATASRVTTQVVADVLGMPLACVRTPDVSALGAAMIAHGLRSPGALAEVSRRWSPVGPAIEPGPQRRVYEALLDEYLSAPEPAACAGQN